MLPMINGKNFHECDEEDLKLLIDNSDFRENEYIDYKKNFSFLEITKDKKDIITQKKAEFKSDVCAFANAEGGYLIYGISDDNGCASELCGVDIPNDDTDKFELDRRNDLAGIQPRVPYLNFHFVKLENRKYIVIIYIKHDSFAPYLHIEDEKNYKVYRRTGNRKTVMTYTELRNMFNQSLSLDKEIYNYRKERIHYYSEQSEEDRDSYSRYLLLHIIPEIFIDPSFNQNMFFLEKNKHISFGSIFSEFGCSYRSMPCVDGLRFLNDVKAHDKTEGYINNNGVIECFFSLKKYLDFEYSNYTQGFFKWDYIWKKIKRTLEQYKETMNQHDNFFKNLNNDTKIYICLSIIGCKGVMTQNPKETDQMYFGYIDRNKLICNPIMLEKLSDDDGFGIGIKSLQIEYLQSIGIKYGKDLDTLMKEVYE